MRSCRRSLGIVFSPSDHGATHRRRLRARRAQSAADSCGACVSSFALRSVVTEPFAFGLANKGARLLADRGRHINHRLDWTAKNDTTHAFPRPHVGGRRDDVAISMSRHVMARSSRRPSRAVAATCRSATRDARDPFCMRVRIVHHDKTSDSAGHPRPPVRVSCMPMAQRHNFALELDRGTMDIWANRLVGKSSIRRKLIGYFHAREQKRHTEVWGFKSFRVLTVTTTESRIDNMLTAQRRVAPDCPPGFFLYSTPERLARHGALGPAWITSKSDNVSLRPRQDRNVRAIVANWLRQFRSMIPRPRCAPPASSAGREIRHVLELDPVGRARTTKVVAAPRKMASWPTKKNDGMHDENGEVTAATGIISTRPTHPPLRIRRAKFAENDFFLLRR